MDTQGVSCDAPALLTTTGRPLSMASVTTMPHASSHSDGARTMLMRLSSESMLGDGSTI